MPNGDRRAQYLVGVDLGGTKILCGVFSRSLECCSRVKISTRPERGPQSVIDRIAQSVRDAVAQCGVRLTQVAGVGVGAPGSIDAEHRTVLSGVNLKWRNVPLKPQLEERLHRPVFIENDGNVSTLGIYEIELKRRPRNMAGIFLGTGIGGGLILNGRLFSGTTRSAAEIGHMVIDVNGPRCSCGSRGCFEALAGRQSLFKKIRADVREGQKTVLTDMLGPKLEDLRSGDLRKAIARGDKYTARLVENASRYAGIAAGNLINLLTPEIIVFGGGLIDALEKEMLPTISNVARQHAFPELRDSVKIKATNLGDDAGIIGAAVFARSLLK